MSAGSSRRGWTTCRTRGRGGKDRQAAPGRGVPHRRRTGLCPDQEPLPASPTPLWKGVIAVERVHDQLHGWVIDLESGKAQAPDEGAAAKIAAQVVDGRVFVAAWAVSTPAAGNSAQSRALLTDATAAKRRRVR